MKSIKTKMMIVVCLLVTISLGIVGGTVSILMYNSSVSSLEKSLTQTAEVASDLVYEYLETYKTVASETGQVARLSNPKTSLKDKTEIIGDKIEQYGFLAGNITDIHGKGILYDVDISDREYFQAGMQGKSSISNVLMSKSLGQYTVIAAAPVWKDGKSGTTPVGVVYYNIDARVLSDLMKKINIGNTGSAYMLDADNYTIAHKNVQLMLDRDNIIEGVKSDPKLAPLAELEAKMTKGESGFGVYEYGGVKKTLAYAPVSTGQGWSIAVNAELSEFINSAIIAIVVTLILVIISIIIGIIVSIILANSITNPIIQIEKAAIQMAKGDYDVNITYNSCDEVGRLANSMRQMMDTTKTIILDTSRGLNEIAKGNFNIAPEAEYIGVFVDIENALKRIIMGLSKTIARVKMSADQVSSGSDQVSSSAQALAQCTTEQASSVEGLSTSVNEVFEKIKNNANNAATANAVANSVGSAIKTSNRQMQQMTSAISEISDSSIQISKIIKTIEDIAFQTNILALNAAVEAARAGAAGKGFAVVADEVRNLATKSSAAAKQTNALIESSVKSVEHGVQIADDTANSLFEVVTGAEKITALIEKISQASAEQSEAISLINLGVDQIAAVVQTNSATSEESAAASEELNSQANVMKEMMSKFKLLDMGETNKTDHHTLSAIY